EDGPFVGAQRDPDALQRLRRANVAEVLRALTAHPDKLSVHGADDVRERDLAGGLRQPEPSFGAALAAHKTRPAQLGEDRLKELPRNVLRPRQLLGRGVITTGGGQFHGCTQSVVSTRRQSHAQHYGPYGGWMLHWPARHAVGGTLPRVR